MSDTRAIRNPWNAGSSLRSRIGTLQQIGRAECSGSTDASQADRCRARSHGAGAGEEHPPVQHRQGRGFGLCLRWLAVDPSPQREPDGFEYEQ